MEMNHQDMVPIMIFIDEAVKYGGGEKIALESAKSLLASGKFKIFLFSFKGEKDQHIDPGFYVEGLNAENNISFHAFKKVFGLIKLQNIKIIHAHGIFTAFHSFIPACILGVRKRIWHLHTIMDKEFMTAKRRLLLRFIALLSSDIIVCSEAAKQALVEFAGIKKEKITVIYNAIKIPEAAVIEHDPQKENVYYPCLGMVARIDGRKGHEQALGALVKLKEKYPKAGLVVIGSGPKSSEILELSKRYGINDSVIFKGQIPEKAVYENLLSFDVFLLPSITEAFPLTVIEAMACGIPVVATDVGGLPEIIESGENGILVPYGNILLLAEAVDMIMKDVKLREKIQINSKKRAEGFKFDNMIKQLIDIYNKNG